MSTEELVQKFRDNARDVIPDAKIARVIDAVLDLENIASILADVRPRHTLRHGITWQRASCAAWEKGLWPNVAPMEKRSPAARRSGHKLARTRAWRQQSRFRHARIHYAAAAADDQWFCANSAALQGTERSALSVELATVIVVALPQSHKEGMDGNARAAPSNDMATMTEHHATCANASRAQAALQDVERRWNTAAQTWNADALTALYVPEALFFGGRPGHAVGQTAILGYFASYTGTLRSASMSLVDQTLIELGADTLLAQGHANFRFVLADGRETASAMRTTWILTRRLGVWQILQHHFSPTPEAPPIE